MRLGSARRVPLVALALGDRRTEDRPAGAAAPPRAGHPRAEAKGEVATRGGTGAGGRVGRLAQSQEQLRGGDPADPEVTRRLGEQKPAELG